MGRTTTEVPRIEAAQARALVDAGRAVVVDVDPQVHQPAEAVAGAVRIPPERFAERYEELPPGCAVVAYCT